MSTVSIRREHNLSAEDCHDALDELAHYLQGHLGAKVRQASSQLIFEGKGFSGTVTIRPGLADGQIKLVMLAMPFKRQLESEINRQLDARLGAQ